MVTTAAKLWFAVAGLALVAGVVYVVASDGEWFGGFVLGSLVVAAGILGVLAVALRDGDVEPAADPAADTVPVRRSLPSGWPALTAVGAALVAVGLAGRNALLYVGFGVLAVVLVEWMVQSWAERATGDHAANQALRNRIMFPVEIPALAALGIALVVLSFSRVMLALPAEGSTVVAMVLAAVVLAIGALIAARPRVSSSLLTGIVAAGAVALVAGGIVSAVVGEREFEHHGTELDHGPDADEAGEGGEDRPDPGADPPMAEHDAETEDLPGEPAPGVDVEDGAGS